MNKKTAIKKAFQLNHNTGKKGTSTGGRRPSPHCLVGPIVWSAKESRSNCCKVPQSATTKQQKDHKKMTGRRPARRYPPVSLCQSCGPLTSPRHPSANPSRPPTTAGNHRPILGLTAGHHVRTQCFPQGFSRQTTAAGFPPAFSEWPRPSPRLAATPAGSFQTGGSGASRPTIRRPWHGAQKAGPAIR